MQVQRYARNKKASKEAVATAITSWHASAAKAYKEKLKQEATQRMGLLKEKDFSAYLQAIQKHSSKHLEQLLVDTDTCLRKIMSQLQIKQAQRQEATGSKGTNSISIRKIVDRS
jgi:glutaredoxin 2